MSSRYKKKTPNVEEEIKKLTFRQLGWPGLILLAMIPIIFFIWWNWEQAKKVPGLGHIVQRMSQDPIPLADPAKFSIAVSHLQGDLEGTPHERLVVEALKEVHGLEILRFDRTIYLEDSHPQQSEQAGHERAQQYLHESGADVLIWGSVLSSGSKALLKLHWTINSKRPAGWRRYPPTENLDLPELFWGDLSTILVFIVTANQEQYEHGSFVADQVTSHITKIRKLLEDKGHSWKPEFRLVLRLLLASASSIVGEQTNQREFYEEAVQLYRSTLQEISPVSNPELWAWIQNNLGLDLVALSDYVPGTKDVSDAVLAFQEALQVRKRDRLPLEWARTRSNLGRAIYILSERKGDSKKLEESIDILRSAIEEQNQQNAPSDWARTQNRLAMALLTLGERENQIEKIQEAEKAVREALKQWSHEATPQIWAGAQINLGNILQAKGGRESDIKSLKESIAAYQAAQRYFTRDRSPLSWAMAQNNLGNTLKVLGEKEGNTTILKEAVQTLQQALEERTRKIVPFDWAQTQANLGIALTSLGVRVKGVKELEQAIQAYRKALEIIDREIMPSYWAGVHFNLGHTLKILGLKRQNPQLICDASQSFRSAWYGFSDLNITHKSSMASIELVSTMQTLEKLASSQEVSRCLAKEQDPQRFKRIPGSRFQTIVPQT
jgi:tetratricopeptide (TPR) repeat protein